MVAAPVAEAVEKEKKSKDKKDKKEKKDKSDKKEKKRKRESEVGAVPEIDRGRRRQEEEEEEVQARRLEFVGERSDSSSGPCKGRCRAGSHRHAQTQAQGLRRLTSTRQGRARGRQEGARPSPSWPRRPWRGSPRGRPSRTPGRPSRAASKRKASTSPFPGPALVSHPCECSSGLGFLSVFNCSSGISGVSRGYPAWEFQGNVFFTVLCQWLYVTIAMKGSYPIHHFSVQTAPHML